MEPFDEYRSRIRELESLLAELISAAETTRKRIVDCLGGMHSGSSIWSNHPYDKGHCAGLTSALTVYDKELAAAVQKARGGMKC